ncbi:NF-kappa-B inhibitor epsilon [Pristis pectinata]|uniref:NF-kappa-B inhibitor epsilon n=1 Tax=Pristis pectinata TaxID=685728 RepID=UPI00223CF1C4|nr:NF-kappa-B inhibitor epsilon [Pristis pectinata]
MGEWRSGEQTEPTPTPELPTDTRCPSCPWASSNPPLSGEIPVCAPTPRHACTGVTAAGRLKGEGRLHLAFKELAGSQRGGGFAEGKFQRARFDVRSDGCQPNAESPVSPARWFPASERRRPAMDRAAGGGGGTEAGGPGLTKPRAWELGPAGGSTGEERCESAFDSAYGSGLLDSFSSRCSVAEGCGRVVEEEEEEEEVVVVEEVFDPWSYLSEEGDTFLHLCIIHEAESLALAFISQSKAEYLNWQNDLFQTPLHLAMYTRQANVVRQLVLKGADVGLQDRNGNTALHLACQYGLEECMQALTKPASAKELALFGRNTTNVLAPQNLERHNWQGLTCLHVAVLCRREAIVQQLLESGAKINTQEATSGRTALHLAVELGEAGLVLGLLQAGGDVDAPMYNGCTPLHLAVGRLDAAVAAALCQAGADPLRPNLEEETPLDLANSNSDVLELCPFDDVRLRGQPVM